MILQRNHPLLSRLCAVVSVGMAFITAARAQSNDHWLTDYEKSGFTASPRHEAMMTYLRRLESASSWIKLRQVGLTPQGRALPLLVLSEHRDFTPTAARRGHRPVILIQSGIHAGEIDGKDASMMLIRDIAVRKSLKHLAAHATLLFMPIFNLDGH